MKIHDDQNRTIIEGTPEEIACPLLWDGDRYTYRVTLDIPPSELVGLLMGAMLEEKESNG